MRWEPLFITPDFKVGTWHTYIVSANIIHKSMSLNYISNRLDTDLRRSLVSQLVLSWKVTDRKCRSLYYLNSFNFSSVMEPFKEFIMMSFASFDIGIRTKNNWASN